MDGCCQTNDYGFPCHCTKTSYRNSQQAEDDGYADYLYDQMRDERDEEQGDD
jgi:hypothetical protein